MRRSFERGVVTNDWMIGGTIGDEGDSSPSGSENLHCAGSRATQSIFALELAISSGESGRAARLIQMKQKILKEQNRAQKRKARLSRELSHSERNAAQAVTPQSGAKTHTQRRSRQRDLGDHGQTPGGEVPPQIDQWRTNPNVT